MSLYFYGIVFIIVATVCYFRGIYYDQKAHHAFTVEHEDHYRWIATIYFGFSFSLFIASFIIWIEKL